MCCWTPECESLVLPPHPHTHTRVSRSPKVKAIMREMRQLEESLPIHPDSAIFLRQVERATYMYIVCDSGVEKIHVD